MCVCGLLSIYVRLELGRLSAAREGRIVRSHEGRLVVIVVCMYACDLLSVYVRVVMARLSAAREGSILRAHVRDDWYNSGMCAKM